MPTNPPLPTPQQQQVLDRIRAQRERLRARRNARLQARAAAATQGRGRVDPEAPLLARLVSFARLHPVAVAAALGAAALAGPSRVMRWAGVLLPAILRMRRG